MWDDTLRHCPREHARFVLEHVSPTMPAGQPFTDRLRITNTGSVTWKARGRRFGGQVTCGLKVCDAQDNVLREDLGRTPLSRDVAPCARRSLEVVGRET